MELFKGYSISENHRPSDDMNPEEKANEIEYTRNMLNYLLALKNDPSRSAVSDTKAEEIKRLRTVMEGKVNEEYFKDLLLPVSSKTRKRINYNKISWKVFSLAPKVMKLIRMRFEDIDHQVYATAVDPISVDEKTSKKWAIWHQKKSMGFKNAVRKRLGAPEMEMEFIPDTLDSLDMYEANGGTKLKCEYDMEDLVRIADNQSNKNEVKRDILDSFTISSMAAVEDYIDQDDDKVKYRSLFIEDLILPNSRYRDYKDIQEWGKIEYWSLNDIRSIRTCSEEDLNNIWEQYKDSFGNEHIKVDSPLDKNTAGGYKIDSMRIPVVYGQWITLDTLYKTSKMTEHGNWETFEEKWEKARKKQQNETYKNRKDRKILSQSAYRVYKGRMVIGTGIVFDYGPDEFIAKKKKTSKPKLSLHVYRNPESSIAAQCEGVFEDITSSFIQLKIALVNSPQAGIAIDLANIENITIGGKKFDPFDILEVKTQKGDLLYRSNTAKTLLHPSQRGASGPPVYEMQGGIGRKFDETVKAIQIFSNLVNEIIGLDRISSGSESPKSDVTTEQTKHAVSATEDALKPHYVGWTEIKNSVDNSTARRSAESIKFSKKSYEAYLPSIGLESVRHISILPEDFADEYEIKIVRGPSMQERMDIIQSAYAAKKDESITHADLLDVQDYISRGNIRLARTLLKYRINKNTEVKMLKDQQNIKAQKEGELAVDQQKHDLAIAFEKEKANQLIRVEEAKSRGDIAKEVAKQVAGIIADAEIQKVLKSATMDAATDNQITNNQVNQ